MPVTKKKRITIKSIADKLELSPSTISYVLHGRAQEKGITESTIKRVRNFANDLGYVPNYWARSLKRQRTKVITSLLGSLGMNWANRLMLGVNSVLRQNDYTSFIAVDWTDSSILKREINSIMERQDEGVICQPNRTLVGAENSHDLYKFLLENGPPTVFVGSILESLRGVSSINTVCWDERPGIKKAIEHFVTTGCKKIAFVGSHHGVVSDRIRFEAFKQSLQEFGIEHKDSWSIWVQGGKFNDLSGYAGDVCGNSNGNPFIFWKKVLEPLFASNDRPDAIFAINDDIGMRIWETLHGMDIKVPDDVSVIGVGNLFDYNMYLTSVVEPIKQMGEAAAEMILKIIKSSDKTDHHITLDCNELVIRQTTRKK